MRAASFSDFADIFVANFVNYFARKISHSIPFRNATPRYVNINFAKITE